MSINQTKETYQIVTTQETDAYDKVHNVLNINISETLNVGNNFTYEHLVKAISELAFVEDFLDELNIEYYAHSLVKIKAKGNYGEVTDSFVLDEFIDLIETNL